MFTMEPIALSPQYITDSDGKRVSVILSITDYLKLLELLEELEDVRLYDEVKSRNEERMPLNEYLAQRQARKNA